ncbi:hypothetical protein V6N13_074335 [Hibiscus sabdariffa]
MDDYKLILGIEFLDQVKAIPMPFANAMSITEGNQACMVSMIRGTKQESKVLSALQIEEEDTNRGSLETTMLALTTCYKGKSQYRTIEKGPGQSRTEGCAAKDLGSQDGSKARGELPGTMGSSGFQKLPARSRRDQDPGGSRQTLDVESIFSCAIEAVIAKFKDPNVVYMVEAPINPLWMWCNLSFFVVQNWILTQLSQTLRLWIKLLMVLSKSFYHLHTFV